MRCQELISIFDMENDVEAFVKSKLKEIISEKHEFNFSGGNHTCFCSIKSPHIPHVKDQYRTVRYGYLEHFCLGQEGETPEGYLHIVIENCSLGDPMSPSRASGYWFLRKA